MREWPIASGMAIAAGRVVASGDADIRSSSGRALKRLDGCAYRCCARRTFLTCREGRVPREGIELLGWERRRAEARCRRHDRGAAREVGGTEMAAVAWRP